MNYFKRFTDFCAGFAAFICTMHIFGEFMSFNPGKDVGMIEKIKKFIDPLNSKDHRAYIILIALLAISIVVSIIFERLPLVSSAVSLAPMIQIMLMLSSGKLKEQPVLCVLLTLLHVVGIVIGAASLDRVDGKRRAFACVNTVGAIILVFGAWVVKKASYLTALPEDAIFKLTPIERDILSGAETEMHLLILKITAFIAVSVLISLVLRDIYFIDAIIAALPLVYTVYLFATEKLTLFGGTVCTLCLVYFLLRMIILFSEPMSKRTVKKFPMPHKA